MTDRTDTLRDVWDLLEARAFLQDHRVAYLAGVDDALRAVSVQRDALASDTEPPGSSHAAILSLEIRGVA